MVSVMEELSGILSKIIENRRNVEINLPEEYADVNEKLRLLQRYNAELFDFTTRLASGQIDAPAPDRRNYLAGGLKQLQAQMRHLTWQTQCVAEGDYEQQVDFMGEFSDAFNSMVRQLKEREARITRQQEFMQRLFDRIEPVYVVSEFDRSNVVYANRQAISLFGLENNSGKPNSILEAMLQLSSDNTDHQIYDDENGRWYSIAVARLAWGDEDSALLFYCVDITNHKERESNLEIAANTDMLTNISNRRAMERSLTGLWKVCQKAQKPLSLLIFDIDHFKKYNDTYGHLQGDKCLAAFAATIMSNAGRKEDVVARYGGEEFVVILPFTPLQNALRIAENMRQSVEDTVILAAAPGDVDIETRVTVSGGVCSVIPSNEYSPEQLLNAADQALYEAKRDGRNRVYHKEIGMVKEETE